MYILTMLDEKNEGLVQVEPPKDQDQQSRLTHKNEGDSTGCKEVV